MKVTARGQVTIPLSIRERLGLLPWTEVTMDVVDDSVRIRKAATADLQGRRAIEAMRRAPKPRRGMTTDQLMAFTRDMETCRRR